MQWQYYRTGISVSLSLSEIEQLFQIVQPLSEIDSATAEPAHRLISISTRQTPTPLLWATNCKFVKILILILAVISNNKLQKS